MQATTRIIVEKGLPKLCIDGNQSKAFNADLIFQDLYITGKHTGEFTGKEATQLTTQVLLVLSNHQHLGEVSEVSRKEIHQVISDILYLSGYIKSAQHLEQRLSETPT
ncbi:hypothetical protein [Litoribacillus peritrichatus]|uniref:Uncharacterized protein n=1 Tax=Litoribacillus peritrichatus TaxID=718191 RepID=A0ABP7M0S6_9GAMM